MSDDAGKRRRCSSIRAERERSSRFGTAHQWPERTSEYNQRLTNQHRSVEDFFWSNHGCMRRLVVSAVAANERLVRSLDEGRQV